MITIDKVINFGLDNKEFSQENGLKEKKMHFFEKKFEKHLQIQKKAVPLHRN